MTEFHNLKRRGFLRGAMAAFPLALLGQSAKATAASAVNPVPAGEDRLGEHHTVGVSSTAFKVLTADSAGALFLFEHRHTGGKKGGPPRHLHHSEDEWFYVIEGQYIAEIGTTRVELKPGDSILGPREVPHAWAFVGDTPGRLLIAFAPANKMEAFFRDNEKRRKGNEYTNDGEIYRAYGMELLGPPLSVK
ncbi:MAG TPA: cupin domain-containing protein [Candidatus Acidoferrum sp.]|nr:cupin domain-containing protein [Candidatus Acidoferrum sp.]